MFFFFSKVLLIFILPINWIIALLVAAVLIKNARLKRRLLLIATLILIIFTNPLLFDLFKNKWDINPVPLKKTGAYSCAIVLGGFVGVDPKSNGFFNSSADRFIQAVRLFNTHKVTHLLISGGNGNLIHDSFAEADWVKDQLKQLNVPDSCVILENKSRNTRENASFSKPLLISKALPPPYLLVTSAFHMRRSLGIFKKARMDVVPYPCNYQWGKGNLISADFLPDAGVLDAWNFYIKEVVGTLVNYL